MATHPRQRTSDTRVNDLAGYTVRALDGRIGTVHKASRNQDELGIVVETGRLFFKKKRSIPAASVTDIDTDSKTVHTSMTTEPGQVHASLHRYGRSN